ncbi:MAG TPA: phosphate ABC transporter permease PstA [Clostridiales bacterium]|nr:phosphate ABC transporter permease PstA [Clostridiales bacterium]
MANSKKVLPKADENLCGTIEPINVQTFSQKMAQYKKRPMSLVIRIIVILAAVLSVGVLLFLIAYILVMGIPNLTLDLFSWKYTSDNVSLMPALVNTILMTLLSLVIAAPLGIFAAIYLVEYAKRGNKFVGVIRVTAETLSGIPSIVYGLFGMLFFVTTLKWGYSIIAGAFTLAIMILPLIMRTTEEALKTVPDSFREGSFGLGAGRLRTVFKVILPSAIPGILAGVILAIGRIVGESAALLYTAGTVAQYPESLTTSTRTLSVHMYVLTNEGLHTNQAYATAVVLLVLVVLINALSSFVAKKFTKGKTGE